MFESDLVISFKRITVVKDGDAQSYAWEGENGHDHNCLAASLKYVLKD